MATDTGWAISNHARSTLERCDLFQDLGTEQLMEIAALVEEHMLEPDERCCERERLRDISS